MTKAQTIYRFTAMNEGTPLQDHPGINLENRFSYFASRIQSLSITLARKVTGLSWNLQNYLWTRQNQLHRIAQNCG